MWEKNLQMAKMHSRESRNPETPQKSSDMSLEERVPLTSNDTFQFSWTPIVDKVGGYVTKVDGGTLSS